MSFIDFIKNSREESPYFLETSANFCLRPAQTLLNGRRFTYQAGQEQILPLDLQAQSVQNTQKKVKDFVLAFFLTLPGIVLKGLAFCLYRDLKILSHEENGIEIQPLIQPSPQLPAHSLSRQAQASTEELAAAPTKAPKKEPCIAGIDLERVKEQIQGTFVNDGVDIVEFLRSPEGDTYLRLLVERAKYSSINEEFDCGALMSNISGISFNPGNQLTEFGNFYLGSEYQAARLDKHFPEGEVLVVNVPGVRREGVHPDHYSENFFEAPGSRFSYLEMEGIVDVEGSTLPLHFVDKIIAEEQRGKKVFFHCKEGKSRSAAMLIATLMKARGSDLETVKSEVLEKRAGRSQRDQIQFCPNPGFLEQLKQYDQSLQASQASELRARRSRRA